MTLKHIRDIPKDVFEQKDVTVFLRFICDSEEWGAYFPDAKIIELNILDENGTILEEDLLVKTMCHELAHHIQYKLYKPKRGAEHDEKFHALFWQLLGCYYEGKIPEKVKKLIEEEEDFLDD